MDDPEASKPDDWDEDAPEEILDEKATIPEDWDEDAEFVINDPSAVMPDDWDEEEDGESLFIDEHLIDRTWSIESDRIRLKVPTECEIEWPIECSQAVG